MVFCGNGNIESIFFHDEGGNDAYSIDLTTHAYEPMFMVSCSYKDGWEYEFCYDRTSYEQIKNAIMSTIFEAKDSEQVLEMLSEIFENGFEDILIENDDDDDANEIEYVSESKYVN